MNSGKPIPASLPWLGDNPNQGRDANYVVMEGTESQEIGLIDAPPNRPSCVECVIPKNSQLTLRGICEYSVLSKNLKNFPYSKLNNNIFQVTSIKYLTTEGGSITLETKDPSFGLI